MNTCQKKNLYLIGHMCLLGLSGSQSHLLPFLWDSALSHPSKPRPLNIASPVPNPWTATLKTQTLASQSYQPPDLSLNSQPQHYLLSAPHQTYQHPSQTPALHHRKVFLPSIITATASSVLPRSTTSATPRTIPSRPQTASAVPPAQTQAISRQ
jgi:hypothetical protein